MIVFAQMVSADRISETKQSILNVKDLHELHEEDKPYFDRFVIVVNETIHTKIKSEDREWFKKNGCEVYNRYWNDNFPDARNAYLDKVQNGDWVVVSDSDEYFCSEFIRNIRDIVKQAEQSQVGLMLINSHDVWLEDDIEQDEIKSDFYKNLIFKKTPEVKYVGVGNSQNVHEELKLPPNVQIMKLNDNYYYRHIKERTIIWQRAARNVYIGGGGNNVGTMNPHWHELRAICESIGINTWEEFRNYITKTPGSDILDSLEQWFFDNRKKGYDWENEMADMFLWYKHLHPERVSDDVKVLDMDNSRASIMKQIEELYMQILGRHADQPGKEFYTALIESGKNTLEDVRKTLLASDEYQKKQFGSQESDIIHVDRVKVDVDVHLTDAMVYNTMIKKSKYLRDELIPELRVGRKLHALLLVTKKVESDGKGTDYTSEIQLEPVIELFWEQCPPDIFPMVLNIGAGAGTETNMLKQHGYTVVGITYGADNITYAKEQFNIVLKQMDMQDLQFPGKIFDATFSCQAFEHSFSAWLHILEMRRVLRDGGRAFIDVPNPDDDDILDVIWHTEALYPNQIRSLFTKAGFKEIMSQDERRFCFEKLPDGDPAFKMWGYVKYIMQELEKI